MDHRHRQLGHVGLGVELDLHTAGARIARGEQRAAQESEEETRRGSHCGPAYHRRQPIEVPSPQDLGDRRRGPPRDRVPPMGGGWIGYIYAIGGCMLLVLLIGGSTMVLYAVARARAHPRANILSMRKSEMLGPILG